MGTIRHVFTVLTPLLPPLLLLSGSQGAEGPAKGEYLVYAGTYTRQSSKGIYAYRFQAATGKLDALGLAVETTNPSFLAVHPNGKFLYAVGEVSSYGGEKGGAVSAFVIDHKTGKLTLLNSESSGGAGPCHLVVDKTGKNVLVANYGGGSVAVLPVKDDGSLGKASTFIQHTGSSVNPDRQRGPHAHCVTLSSDNRFAFVADLGLDKIMIYRFDPAKGSLTANTPPFAKVNPGAGPRHFTFSPDERFGYVINEIQSTLTAFSYDKARGALKELQTISTLPAGYSGESWTAEVEVDRRGRFLYGSNRGHDSIAVFAIDAGHGTLKPAGRVSTEGKTPRNFAIDPTGSYLFAANQDSDNIVVFRIDPKTGLLSPSGQVLKVGSPVCVTFVPAK